MRGFPVWVACLAWRVLFPTLMPGQNASGSAGAASRVHQVEQVGSPVQWRATQTPHEPVRPRQEFGVTVQATVATGWHLYALDQPEDGPIALEFSAQAGKPVTLVSVGADRPERELTASSPLGVNFYPGQPRFRLRMRAGAALTAGVGVAVIGIRYQACNQRMCLPPRTATVSFPLWAGD